MTSHQPHCKNWQI